MLFSLFFGQSLSKTSLNVRSVINGVWFVNKSMPLDGKRNVNFYHANISEIRNSNASKIIITDDSTNKTVRRYIANWENHYTLQLKQGYRVIAKMEFSPYLQPQVSATGAWDGTGVYNAAIITSNTMQVHILEPSASEWTYYTFLRDMDAFDDEPIEWQDKVFGLVFLGITVLLTMGVTKIVQKCLQNQTMKEAYKILEEEEKGGKKSGKGKEKKE